ncbi:MAG: Dps family protein [Gammaproteobacteria bacterium]|nr:Dps family protein [Gammaproteobacteria bacterium]
MNVNIGIDEKHRKSISDGLSHFLADTYLLYLMTHNFHWNVTGPHFRSLHQMFEEQYNEIWLAVDEIAERIRALGVKAPGTTAQFHKLATIKEETDIPAWDKMVKILVEGHEACARNARELFKVADAGGDDGTADLATIRMKSHEKTAWMLRSLIQ